MAVNVHSLIAQTNNKNLLSPLFRLPQEIKDHVYIYLYPRTVHVALPLLPFSGNKCRFYYDSSPLPQRKRCLSAQKMSYSSSISTPNRTTTSTPASVPVSCPQVACYTSPDNMSYTGTPVYFAIPLVCRQLWYELETAVNRDVTWYFTSEQSFAYFTKRGTMAARVQRVAFVRPFDVDGTISHSWVWELRAQTLERLVNLRVLGFLCVQWVSKKCKNEDETNEHALWEGHVGKKMVGELGSLVEVVKGNGGVPKNGIITAMAVVCERWS